MRFNILIILSLIVLLSSSCASLRHMVAGNHLENSQPIAQDHPAGTSLDNLVDDEVDEEEVEAAKAKSPSYYQAIKCQQREYFEYLHNNIRKVGNRDPTSEACDIEILASDIDAIADTVETPQEDTVEDTTVENSVEKAEDESLTAAIKNINNMPQVTNNKVDRWIRFFTGRGRRTYQKWLDRGYEYKDITQEILRDEGLPEELFYLAMIESGFNNKAHSHAAATGMWQFMRGTAKLYGMKINYWVDERRDPYKATLTASRYLKELYNTFDDWYLAMAAYNGGPGKIRKAIRRSKSRDFWRIARTWHIRKETKNYIPKFLAALHIGQNLEKYEFKVNKDVVEPFPHTTIKVDRPISLKELAEKLNVTKKQLKHWNPVLVRPYTPPTKYGSFFLRLPEYLLPKYAQVESDLSKVEIADVKMYRIRRGDTLSQIARKYGVRMREILAYNPSLRPRYLRPGKNIAIPVPDVRVERKNNERII